MLSKKHNSISDSLAILEAMHFDHQIYSYMYINIEINYDKERRSYELASFNGQTLLITLDEKVVVTRPLKHLKSINQSVNLSSSKSKECTQVYFFG